MVGSVAAVDDKAPPNFDKLLLVGKQNRGREGNFISLNLAQTPVLYKYYHSINFYTYYYAHLCTLHAYKKGCTRVHAHTHTHTHTHIHAHTLTAVGPVPRGRRSEGQEASSTDPLPPWEELLSLPQEQGGG